MWTPELSRVKNDIEAQLPDAKFDKEFSLSLGPIALSFARLVTKLVPDANQASDYLRDVSRVQVAVYSTESLPPVHKIRMPDRLQRMSDDDWETAVKVREEDSVVWVMYKIDKDTIRDLYVVVLNDEELVIVKARGQLDRLLARALSETNGVPGIPNVNHDDEDAF